MGTIDKSRALFGDMAFRSVYHDVARLDAARAPSNRRLGPPNVASIAEARARQLKRRRHGLRGNDEEPHRRP